MPQPPADTALHKRKLEAWARDTVLMPWIVFAVCLLVTLQLWSNAQLEAERNLYNDFQTQVDTTGRRISQRMLDYEQVLAGVRGIFAASKESKS